MTVEARSPRLPAEAAWENAICRVFLDWAVPRLATLACGAVLLVGAAVLLLVELGGLPFSWVPLVLLGPAGARAHLPARGHRGAVARAALGPGWILSCVGLTEALRFRRRRPADSFELAPLTLLAAGTGALLAHSYAPARCGRDRAEPGDGGAAHGGV
jgi:hypothetical protein